MKITDKVLQKHLDNNSIAPSYLLIDKDIIKMKQIATWFASKYLNQKIETEKTVNADTFWLVPKEGSNAIHVEATEAFIEKTSYAAISGKKLFIICDAATMTQAAQNKLLKTIEDTPAGTCFILLASTSETLLNTIKSRCVTVYPDPIKTEISGIEFNSLTDAALYKENPNAETIFKNVEQLLKAKTLDATLSLTPILTSKENFPLTMIAFNHYINREIQNTDYLTIQKLNTIIKKLAIINRNIAANCNLQNAFDSLLVALISV